MKLLKIESEGSDVVLIVVEDDYDEDAVIETAKEVAEMFGVATITEELAIPDSFADNLYQRPFVG